MFSHPWYAVLVVAHVLAAVVGFGAIGMTGAYARQLRTTLEPFASAALVRFFRPGRNLAARTILLVPVFGGAVVAPSGDAHRLYPYLGLAVWLAATGVASGLIWPAEARIQGLVAIRSTDTAAIAALARRCERGATVTSLLFVTALAVMIAQPN